MAISLQTHTATQEVVKMAISLNTHTHTHTPCNHPLPDSRLGEKQDPGVSHLHLPLQDAGPSLARLSSSARSNFSSHPVVTWHRTLLGTGGSEQEAR